MLRLVRQRTRKGNLVIARIRYQMHPAESFSARMLKSESLHELEEGGVLTFGRARRDIRLAGSDPAVSKDAGEFVHVGGALAEGGYVKVVNNSTTGWIFGFGARGYNVSIPPRSEFIITQPKTRYLIEGNFGVHELDVTVVGMPLSRFVETEEEHEPTGSPVQEQTETNQSEAARALRNKFDAKQRMILSAVFDEFMTPAPVPMPKPQTGQAAAERLRTDPRFRKIHPGAAGVDAGEVSTVVKFALGEARRLLVAGTDGGVTSGRTELGGPHRALGTNQELHRLALFLLGTGIIEPQGKRR